MRTSHSNAANQSERVAASKRSNARPSVARPNSLTNIGLAAREPARQSPAAKPITK